MGGHPLTFSYPCLSWFAGPQTAVPGTVVAERLLSSSGNCSPPPLAPSSCLPPSSSLLGVSASGGQTSHGAGEEERRASLVKGVESYCGRSCGSAQKQNVLHDVAAPVLVL